jgi:hypothetical protein
MYGTWFAITLSGILALVALIAFFVGTSPLFAVAFVLFMLAFLGSLLLLLRPGGDLGRGPSSGAAPHGSESGPGESAGALAGELPRSGGEPASGEGPARGSERAERPSRDP